MILPNGCYNLAMTKKQAVAIRVLVVGTLAAIIVGTVFYHYVEQFSWIDAYYFSIITLTTVGYGDLSPQTDVGKLFTTVYILVGVGIITSVITTFAKYRTEKRIEKKIK